MITKKFYSDICIIGSGIAGLSLANFLNDKIKINLIDKGSKYFDPNKQMKPDVFIDNDYIRKDKQNTLSQLGGTGNIWASRIMKLDKFDFENTIEEYKWPLTYTEINEYYKKAFKFFKIIEEKFIDKYENLKLKEIYWPNNKKIFSYNSKFIKNLEKKNNINFFLEYNLVEIEFNDNTDHVINITCKKNDKFIKFFAKEFILCCGAIEIVKILFNSQVKLNNQFKFSNLGKYYMDHPTIKTNSIKLNKKELIKYFMKHKYSNSFQLGFTHKDNKIYNNNYSVFNYAINEKFEIFENQLRKLKRLNLNKLNFKNLLNPSLMFNYLLFFNWAYNPQLLNIMLNYYFNINYKQEIHIQMSHHMEQKPNISNALNLSENIDINNLRELKLNNNISIDSIESSKSLNNKINNLFKFENKNFDLDLRTISDASHHMGTTRMHSNPKMGVVNKDCRVNDIDNLYILGPSVFTTSGHANPVLTVIALSIRMAKMLNEK